MAERDDYDGNESHSVPGQPPCRAPSASLPLCVFFAFFAANSVIRPCMTPVSLERIDENLARVRQRIAEAAARGGRPLQTVRLVAVTKYVGVAEIEMLLAAGCWEIGESRPQDLWQKTTAIAGQRAANIQWHLVGHLQRNKVRRTLPLVQWIHSVDSLRLLETLEEEARALPRRPKLLIEVNISGDAAKHGFPPHEIEPLLPKLAGLRHVQVCGLMTMAALEGGVEMARRNFSALRDLRDQLQAAAPEGLSLSELSMGMSGDFEIAIEEGASMVRVGSALFE